MDEHLALNGGDRQRRVGVIVRRALRHRTAAVLVDKAAIVAQIIKKPLICNLVRRHKTTTDAVGWDSHSLIETAPEPPNAGASLLSGGNMRASVRGQGGA
jgi:hypothetical protein